jgi:putative membrane protein (TIGR04086 family)
MSNVKSTKRASHREPTVAPSLMRDVGKGILINMGIALLLNLVASVAAYFSPDPVTLARPLGLAASAITALLGGWITVRIHRHAALWCGLASGCAMITLMLLFSFCVKPLASGYSLPITLLLHFSYVALSLVGAFLGIHRKPKSTVKRRTTYASRSL